MAKQNFEPHEVVEILRRKNHKEVELVTTFLYRLLRPLVISYILKHGGSRDEAKDIFQETILFFFRQVDSFKFEAKSKKEMEAYFLSIAHYRWLKKVESETRRNNREHEFFKERNASTAYLPLEQLENDEKRENFAKLLDKLGEPCKCILTAYYSDELSIKEIAEMLNIGNAEAVKVRKFRCLAKLKILLEKSELFYP